MKRALLLDKNYMALSLVSWKKAIKLMVKGKAEALDGRIIRRVSSASDLHSIPSIIRLLTNVPWKAHSRLMRFSRKNVMIRDGFKCQYCGIKIGKTATIDHIVPKSRGGKTNYLNCVACCRSCNNKKSDKPLKETSMALLNKPRKPTFLTLYKHLMDNPPEEWCDYIIGLKV